ncbi:zinc ribbon-containing protein [Haloarcula pellucida]|nr:zinc ribbon-containing protein [Halomicroarcula pellucida]MBX0348865.1 zinc ribbon-containing protein [Halomicroarcula pellucida]
MVQRESSATGRKVLVCRKCEYRTDVLRPSCPECGGDMIAAAREE